MFCHALCMSDMSNFCLPPSVVFFPLPPSGCCLVQPFVAIHFSLPSLAVSRMLFHVFIFSWIYYVKLAAFHFVKRPSRLRGRFIMLMAPNGHAFTHIPQPMHMGSLIAANLDVRFTETQIFPEHASEKVNLCTCSCHQPRLCVKL